MVGRTAWTAQRFTRAAVPESPLTGRGAALSRPTQRLLGRGGHAKHALSCR